MLPPLLVREDFSPASLSACRFFFPPCQIRCETWAAPLYTTMFRFCTFSWSLAWRGVGGGDSQARLSPWHPAVSNTMRHHLISSHPHQDSALGHVTFSCWKKEMLWSKSELRNVRPHFSPLCTQSITGAVARGSAPVAWVRILSTKHSLKHQGKLSLLSVRAS